MGKLLIPISLIKTLWFSGVIALLISWYLPLMTVSRFFIWQNELSILSAVGDLAAESHYLLMLVVFLASMLLPLSKYCLLGWLLFNKSLVKRDHSSMNTNSHVRMSHWLHQMGRWSFIDIFVIALLVTGLKLRGLVEVDIEIGFYCFFYAAAVSLISLPLLNWQQSK